MMILLDGDWLPRIESLSSLLSRGHGLRMSEAAAEDGPMEAAQRPAGVLVVLAENADLARAAATARGLEIPWIAWDLRGNAAREAFRHGAVAVLPSDTPPDELADIVSRSIPGPDDSHDREPQTSRFRAGDTIPTRHDSTIIEVVSGIVGMRSYQTNGFETLMGLFGQGDALTAQPSYPGCQIEFFAHQHSEVLIRNWGVAVGAPGFADRLRRSNAWIVAWSSMQSRPQVEDRLRGILWLVAERFGERKGDWWDLDGVRMTHQQMSAAARSTRPTVTKILLDMEHNGLIAYRDHDGIRSVLLRAR